MEFDGNAYGTNSHCFFAAVYISREYQVIGAQGVLRIIFWQRDQNPEGGRIILSPRQLDEQGTMQVFNFKYNGRIHYNGAPYVVKHFMELMEGAAQPFTTVEQAFMAEMIACAAYQSADRKAWVALTESVPPDLRSIFDEQAAG